MLYNNFVPLRLYSYRTYLRFQFPEAYDATTDRFLFREHEAFQQIYVLRDVIWVLNATILPPVPRGTQVFMVSHRIEFPYEMTFLSVVDHVQHAVTTETFYFVAYVVPVPRTREFRYQSTFRIESQHNYEVYSYVTTGPANPVGGYTRKVPYSPSFFGFPERPPAYWRCTAEAVCVPTDDARASPMLRDCQLSCYAHLRNRRTNVGGSSAELARHLLRFKRS